MDFQKFDFRTSRSFLLKHEKDETQRSRPFSVFVCEGLISQLFNTSVLCFAFVSQGVICNEETGFSFQPVEVAMHVIIPRAESNDAVLYGVQPACAEIDDPITEELR